MELINPFVMLSLVFTLKLHFEDALKMNTTVWPPSKWEISTMKNKTATTTLTISCRSRLHGTAPKPSTSVNFTRCPKLNEVKMWKWTRRKRHRKNVEMVELRRLGKALNVLCVLICFMVFARSFARFVRCECEFTFFSQRKLWNGKGSANRKLVCMLVYIVSV